MGTFCESLYLGLFVQVYIKLIRRSGSFQDVQEKSNLTTILVPLMITWIGHFALFIFSNKKSTIYVCMYLSKYVYIFLIRTNKKCLMLRFESIINKQRQELMKKKKKNEGHKN